MSEQLISALLLASLAGAAMPLGALIASVEHIRSRWLKEEFRHGVIAFGGGALLSAVALVLVPEGAERLPPLVALLCFGLGGLIFSLVDRWLQSRGGAGAQLLAMLLDFIPEAMALGALLAGDPATAILLAGLITLQNLPEGFNAFRELRAAYKLPSGRIIGLFALMALFGPAAALLGEEILVAMPEVLGAVMMFSAGGILYLTFADIAPQAQLEKHWAPPLWAVAGFLLGLAGSLYMP